ncbi:uncharacterized protein TNCV_631301 [Trichonephila clavipes]|nr:uncharacterized protein TNCV_1281511 [Trichonephila clavipes]GFW97125.1 uncharacterized protein TNCV_631301 [Trichonephila clavipes]
MDSSPVSMLPIHTGDILRLKAFVYNVCTVKTDVVIHKQKFSTHGTPKQTYMLFQNDILIDLVCHRYTQNMQVSSGTKNNSSPNEPSCTTVHRNGIVLSQWCSLGGNGYLALSILMSGENQTAN